MVAGLVVVMAGAAWWQLTRTKSTTTASGALRGANLLLVTVDTLRADRVGVSGLTPTLDALSARGLSFSHAYAHAPVTLPAHASIMTGLSPPAHGVRDNGSYRLAEPRTTLAEILRTAGYRTGAFIGAFVLDARFGLAQGFDEYDDRFDEVATSFATNFVQRRAPEVLRRAGDWIMTGPNQGGPRAESMPWFAWAHLFDPHDPYDAPEQYVSEPYDNEVAFTDAALGRFFARLRRAGLLDNTVVIVTADHGEGLGEHGELTHTLFAYDTTLRVPLIIAGPGIAPAVRDVPVSHVDLLPTVLDLLALDPPAGLAGRSLRMELSANTPVPLIYFEALNANLTRNWAPLTGIVANRWKFIDLPIPELYDLQADPDEMTNVFAQQAAQAGRMQTDLAPLKTFGASASGRVTLDSEVEARLRVLGYTTSRVGRQPLEQVYTEADDPKTQLDVHLAWREVLTQLATVLVDPAGKQDALQILMAQIQEHPRFAPAYTAAATLLIDLGRSSEAVTVLDAAIALGFDTDVVRERLSLALLNAGEPARAAGILETLVIVDAPWADDVNRLGVAYGALGRVDAARTQFRQALEIDATAEIWKNLGVIELQDGNTSEAILAFEESTRADAAYVPGWRLLGAALRPTDVAGALIAWRRVVDLVPADADALLDLAALLVESGAQEDARRYLERYLENIGTDENPTAVQRVRRQLIALGNR